MTPLPDKLTRNAHVFSNKLKTPTVLFLRQIHYLNQRSAIKVLVPFPVCYFGFVLARHGVSFRVAVLDAGGAAVKIGVDGLFGGVVAVLKKPKEME